MRSDVCIIAEGCYPYVAGGVSTWIQQILETMPRLRFSIYYIGANRDAPRRPQYRIPSNVVALQEYFLFDSPDRPGAVAPPWPLDRRQTEDMAEFLRGLERGGCNRLEETCAALQKFASREDLFLAMAHGRESWELLMRQYSAQAPAGLAFLDYFWTVRSLAVPTLCLLRQPLPEARVYHAASTGYAGLAGAKAALTRGAPLILTEHGLYTRERRIEIFNSPWIQEAAYAPHLDMRRISSYFKDWWNSFFRALSGAAYQTATHITTLFEANRQAQLADGAPPARTRLIPNDIPTDALLRIQPRARQAGARLQIGFIGRITSIKDVKTFLHAVAILKDRRVPLDAWLLGPMEEEPGYAAECQELAQARELADCVHFEGRVATEEWLGRLDVVVLTSLSEGMPFVILEANCVGLPVVATEVGSCRDLLLGMTPEDKALGPSGLLTPVASPAATAAAIERLYAAPDLARRLGETGRRRVLARYELRSVMQQYQDLYESCLDAGHWTAGGARAAG